MAAVVATAAAGAAKKLGTMLAKSAVKGATKAVKNKPKRSWTEKIMAIALILITLYLAIAIPLGLLYAFVAPINGGGVCNVDTGDSSDDPKGSAPGAGQPDGTGGSDVGFPEKSASSVFYPVPNGPNLVSSHVGMRATPPGSRDFYGTGSYYHNGLDFASAAGTPILAMADGIVAQAGPNSIGYGSSITLHHTINGKQFSTTYGHIQGPSISVSAGQTVTGGQQIALMGAEGNSTGPHLHFVLTSGVYTQNYSEHNIGPQNNIDPFEFLRSNGATSTETTNIDGTPLEPGSEPPVVCSDGGLSDGMPTAWGGYQNGMIPDDALQSLSWAPDFRLSKKAAAALEAVNSEFKTEFGKNLPVITAYRSSDEQRGDKEVFGWAKVVELDVSFRSAEYKWLNEKAGRHQFVNPIVNQKGEEAENPKRWNYIGSDAEGVSKLPELGSLNDYQTYAGQKLKERGMSDPSELACLVKMWEKESNWNPQAANPTSTARGIPQMMMNIHYGADWETNAAGREYLDNPNKQIDRGLEYVQGRYGTPCKAWNTWQTQQWY